MIRYFSACKLECPNYCIQDNHGWINVGKILESKDIFQWEKINRSSDFPLVITMVHDEKSMAAPHSHDFVELLLVVTGTGSYITPSSEYQLEQGDIFLLHPGQLHGFSNQHHLVVYNILWREKELLFDFSEIEKLPGYLLFFRLEPNSRERKHFKRHLHLDKEQLAFTKVLIERIHSELNACRSGYKLLVRSLLGELFVMICRYFMKQNKEKNNELFQMANVINYIQENYEKQLTRAQLARIVNMSEVTFFRHFKLATGQSPMEYLLNLRLTKAETLLQTTDLLLAEISTRCGFCDSNYFGMQFKKCYHITPHRFRNIFRLKTGH